MATVAWPPADKRTLIGKRIDRLDGPAKATGAAKYTYDINRPGLLFCKLLTSPYAHAEIGGIGAERSQSASRQCARLGAERSEQGDER